MRDYERSGRITAELAGLVRRSAVQARAVLRNARRVLPRAIGWAAGRLRRAVNDAVVIDRTEQVITQAKVRLAGGNRTRRPAWSACTTPTPARSPKAASASRRVRLQGPDRRQRRRHRA